MEFLHKTSPEMLDEHSSKVYLPAFLALCARKLPINEDKPHETDLSTEPAKA